jgi:hypothetical protein
MEEEMDEIKRRGQSHSSVLSASDLLTVRGKAGLSAGSQMRNFRAGAKAALTLQLSNGRTSLGHEPPVVADSPVVVDGYMVLAYVQCDWLIATPFSVLIQEV